MNIQEFRKLTSDAKLESLFSLIEHQKIRIDVLENEVVHLRGLEDERVRIRKKKARAARSLAAAKVDRQRPDGQEDPEGSEAG